MQLVKKCFLISVTYINLIYVSLLLTLQSPKHYPDRLDLFYNYHFYPVAIIFMIFVSSVIGADVLKLKNNIIAVFLSSIIGIIANVCIMVVWLMLQSQWYPYHPIPADINRITMYIYWFGPMLIGFIILYGVLKSFKFQHDAKRKSFIAQLYQYRISKLLLVSCALFLFFWMILFHLLFRMNFEFSIGGEKYSMNFLGGINLFRFGKEGTIYYSHNFSPYQIERSFTPIERQIMNQQLKQNNLKSVNN